MDIKIVKKKYLVPRKYWAWIGGGTVLIVVLGLNMDQLGNKPALAIDELTRSLNIRLQSKIAVQQSPSNTSKATNSLNNTAKPVPITPVNRTATPMIPSTKARTCQREQSAL